jgi:hypothetical protein
MVTYLASEQGRSVRELLAQQMVQTLDQLQDETVEQLLNRRWKSADIIRILSAPLQNPIASPSTSTSSSSAETALPAGLPRQWPDLRSFNRNAIDRFFDTAARLIVEEDILDSASNTPTSSSSSSINALKKIVKVLRSSNFNYEKSVSLGKRVRSSSLSSPPPPPPPFLCF